MFFQSLENIPAKSKTKYNNIQVILKKVLSNYICQIHTESILFKANKCNVIHVRIIKTSLQVNSYTVARYYIPIVA
jgi:hypothetical protein